MSDYIAVPGPAEIHPFADATAGDDFIFLSGIASFGATVEEQVRGCFAQITARLEALGSSPEEIVLIRPFATDRSHVEAMNATLREVLPSPAPASGALLITQLVLPELLVEFEVTARRGARLIAPAETAAI